MHAGAPHGEEVVLDLDAALASTCPVIRVLDDAAPPERWLLVPIGAVALLALHDARLKPGDHVVVVGLGAIGLLTSGRVTVGGCRSAAYPSTGPSTPTAGLDEHPSEAIQVALAYDGIAPSPGGGTQ